LLDLGSMENQPLGHNHAAMVKAGFSKDYDNFVINAGVRADEVATAGFAQAVRDQLVSIAPNDMPAVTLTEGRSAVEHAI